MSMASMRPRQRSGYRYLHAPPTPHFTLTKLQNHRHIDTRVQLVALQGDAIRVFIPGSHLGFSSNLDSGRIFTVFPSHQMFSPELTSRQILP